MLKGQTFSEQVFESKIYSLFTNIYLSGRNGVARDYKNGMAVSYSGSNVTISSGAICIQGRILEEDSSTTLNAGTSLQYCKLVIEVDLDKTNTENDFQQGTYKIVTGESSYPSLTQTDIANNASGKYQYELARFRTSSNGISDFQDMRTFLESSTEFKKNSDFAVMSINIPISTAERTVIEEVLPEGFTATNSVVISIVSSLGNSYRESYYPAGGYEAYPITEYVVYHKNSTNKDVIELTVGYIRDIIELWGHDVTISGPLIVRVVLMKIS